MRLCADRVHAGGAVLLRTQVREGPGVADALAVACTFLQTVESGWAAVAIENGWVDLLLGGPAEAVPPPVAREGVSVLPLRGLLAPPFDVPPVKLLAPESFRRHRLPESVPLRRRLEKE